MRLKRQTPSTGDPRNSLDKHSRQGQALPGTLEAKHMTEKQANTPKVRRYQNWLSIRDEFDVQFLLLDIRQDRELFQMIRERTDWIVDIKEGERVLLTRTPVPVGAFAAA